MRDFVVASLLLAACKQPAEPLPPPAAAPVWERGPDLPAPISNNAVASVTTDSGSALYSFLGLDQTKLYSGVRRDVFKLDGKQSWERVGDVPGELGRLASTAQSIDGRIYVVGGYTVAPDGHEVSVPEVNVYDPTRARDERWSLTAPMPVPVDDAVSGVARGLLFLVSGWHDDDNVANVQVYDPATNAWRQATPIIGPPVFGHSGGIVGDTIIYCDGVLVDPSAKPKFKITSGCFAGQIDPEDASVVAWTEMPGHPGPARYRMAVGRVPGSRTLVFAGGAANPYNYDGVGYDGVPSAPSDDVYGFDFESRSWEPMPSLPEPTMDHRGLAAHGGHLWLVGGMTTDQRVLAHSYRLSFANAASRFAVDR